LKNGEEAMEDDKGMISKAEALNQIRIALRRLALLYYYFARTLFDELGEEQGIELTRKAVNAYGAHVGREARRKAEERGLALIPKNFESDLPNLPWRTEIVDVEGEERVRVHRCPLAKEWLDIGESKIGRLYCFVDQAKCTVSTRNTNTSTSKICWRAIPTASLLFVRQKERHVRMVEAKNDRC
jgi:hypothetical protein